MCAFRPKASSTDAEHVSTVEPCSAPRVNAEPPEESNSVLLMQHPDTGLVTARYIARRKKLREQEKREILTRATHRLTHEEGLTLSLYPGPRPVGAQRRAKTPQELKATLAPRHPGTSTKRLPPMIPLLIHPHRPLVVIVVHMSCRRGRK